MGEFTKIQWTDRTFNPWWGCTKVAAGCTNCYAEAFSKRTGKAKWGAAGNRVKTSHDNWKLPRKWNRTAESEGIRLKVFCASMADVFEDWEGPILNHHGERLFANGDTVGPATMNDLRRELFKMIDTTPHLDWQLLTKRPENIIRMWPEEPCTCGVPHMVHSPDCSFGDKYHRKNVWLLTSVAEQADAERNIPELLKCRDLSPVLGLSCEPLVGPVDIRKWLTPEVHHHPDNDLSNRDVVAALSACARSVAKEHGMGLLDWVIVGGESGHGARACRATWVRDLVRQCEDASVRCFVKQLGSNAEDGHGCHRKLNLSDPKGGDMDEWPDDFRVREFPCA